MCRNGVGTPGGTSERPSVGDALRPDEGRMVSLRSPHRAATIASQSRPLRRRDAPRYLTLLQQLRGPAPEKLARWQSCGSRPPNFVTRRPTERSCARSTVDWELTGSPTGLSSSGNAQHLPGAGRAHWRDASGPSSRTNGTERAARFDAAIHLQDPSGQVEVFP